MFVAPRFTVLMAISMVAMISGSSRQTVNEASAFSVHVPRVWDDADMAAVELPLADPMATPKHITAEYYYRIPVRPIYKSYPVYALGREPQGYQEWLNQQEPETLLNPWNIKDAGELIRAGEIVFDAPIFYNAVVKPPLIKDPKWYENTGVLVGKDGNAALFPICDS
jgi:hypothetical protein